MTLLGRCVPFLATRSAPAAVRVAGPYASAAWSTHRWPPARDRWSATWASLAATLARLDDAAAHFEAAIAVNDGIRAWPLVAHTQLRIRAHAARRRDPAIAKARELLGQALATAEELGMTALTDRAQALRLQADAVATG